MKQENNKKTVGAVTIEFYDLGYYNRRSFHCLEHLEDEIARLEGWGTSYKLSYYDWELDDVVYFTDVNSISFKEDEQFETVRYQIEQVLIDRYDGKVVRKVIFACNNMQRTLDTWSNYCSGANDAEAPFDSQNFGYDIFYRIVDTHTFPTPSGDWILAE